MLDQREVGGRRLGIEGINGCAAKLAAGERLDQGGLVDQAAPRTVDDSHRRLHHADRAGVDEVARLGIERRVQRDKVAAGPEFVEPRHALDPVLERLLGRQQRVETDHGHAEAEGAPGHGEADPAQTDHAQGLALELGTGEGVTVPLSRLEAVIGHGHVAGQGEHQCHGVLGRRDRVAPGCVHDHDALAGRGRDVDVVHADPCADDGLEPRLVLEDLGGQLRSRPDRDPIGIIQGRLERRGVLGQPGIDDDLDSFLGTQQGQSFLGKLVGHQHAMRHDQGSPLHEAMPESRSREGEAPPSLDVPGSPGGSHAAVSPAVPGAGLNLTHRCRGPLAHQDLLGRGHGEAGLDVMAQLGQGHLQCGQRGNDINFVGIAQVADPNDLPLELVLPADRGDSEPLGQLVPDLGILQSRGERGRRSAPRRAAR